MVHKIDSSTAVSVMPTPGTAGTPGFFVDGNPTLGVAGTVVTADWLNAIQSEITNVLSAANVTPDKTKQDQLILAIRNLTRTKLTGATTFYVNASTGSDTTGTGTSLLPFASISAAWGFLVNFIDLNNQAVTLSVANGTYGSTTLQGIPVGVPVGGITVQGNTTTPASCLISATSTFAVNCYQAGLINLKGFKLVATGSFSNFAAVGIGLLVQYGSQVTMRDMDFGACGYTQIQANAGGSVILGAGAASTIPYTISGSAPSHMIAVDGGVCSNVGGVITLTGIPAFSTAFLYASNGICSSFLNTYSGASTGVRTWATLTGVVNCAGNATTASNIPGTTNTTATLGGIVS